MHAAILSIGDELTFGESLDTNSAWLAARLWERGIAVSEHRTLGDDAALIGATISDLARTCRLIITTGGLGPTADDLTRHGLAAAVTPGEALVQDERALQQLKALYAQRGRTMPATNVVQALRPRTATMIANPNGTAMGLADQVGDCRVFAIPGPPREMKPMFEAAIAPTLPPIDDNRAVSTRFVHAYGLSESEAAQRLGDLLARGRTPQLGITVSESVLTVRIRAMGPRTDITAQVRADEAAVRAALQPYDFGADEQTLASVVGTLLSDAQQTVATAESCTGGWLGAMLVEHGGASAYYLGGWVTYADAMKMNQLGVADSILQAHGAVSPQTAEAMAVGALQRSGADHALSITGIAGPNGGTEDKPVGLVFVGRASGRKDAAIDVDIRRFNFVGDRTMVRRRSAMAALQMLRFHLLGVPREQRLLWETPETAAAGQASAPSIASDGV